MMQSHSRMLVAGVFAAMVLALGVGSSSANRLSISHGSLWRAVFRPLRFNSSGLTAFSCSLTLEGSFHSGTIRKVERALIGHITHASLGPCEVGSATVLTETLPWHVQYLGFLGRLPEISGVRLIFVGLSLQLHEPILNSMCLLRTTQTEPAGGILELAAGNENRLVTSLKADTRPRIRCGSFSAEFGGTATVTEVPGGSANLLIKLI